MTGELEPGTVVAGPFYGYGQHDGVGVIVARSRELWTQVGEGYVPVRVIVGDRCNGGYKPANLRPLKLRETR